MKLFNAICSVIVLSFAPYTYDRFPVATILFAALALTILYCYITGRDEE